MQIVKTIVGLYILFQYFFLVDTSESMPDASMQKLNEILNCYKEKIKAVKNRVDRIDVAIVEFNSEVKVVQPFVPVDQMEKIHLTPNGHKCLESGIRKAVEIVDQQNHFYNEQNESPYTPWVLMITKGQPDGDLDGITEIIQQYDDENRMRFWCMLLDDTDEETFKKLCHGKRVLRIDLNECDFVKGFFDWIPHKLTVNISVPGEKPTYIPIERPEHIDYDDPNMWMWW